MRFDDDFIPFLVYLYKNFLKFLNFLKLWSSVVKGNGGYHFAAGDITFNHPAVYNGVNWVKWDNRRYSYPTHFDISR